MTVEGFCGLMKDLSTFRIGAMEVWVVTGEVYGKPVGKFQKDKVIYEHLEGFRTFDALLGKTLPLPENPYVKRWGE